MIDNCNNGKETVGNKYVIKCLKELKVYGAYTKVVKKRYKNDRKTIKLHLFVLMEWFLLIMHLLG